MSSLTVEEDQKWLPTHVQVTVLRGRGLRGKGKHGTSDVYTIIQLGKEKYSTGVAEKTTEPEWREECSFELQPGVLESGAGYRELVLTLMHRALIGMDVFLGQAVILLDRVFHESRGVKNQWFRLNSKTGKKEKERGDIQVSVQFTRNNLTASMYDLVMKDKSASTFSKLKDHMRGKRKSSDKDSSSAILPSGYGSLYRMRQRMPSDGGGEEDYEDDEGGEARRSKMRTFFLRGKLRKSSDTRSSTSLASESSESSSRGGSLSPTAGISVVVSDLSNSPSNSSNLTADNSPEHTANTSCSLQCEYGDEAGEITIAVPQHTVCVNGSHAYNVQPLDPGSGKPADSLGLGLLSQKPLPHSVSLQNLSPLASTDLPVGLVGDGRRWSFDKPGEEEKAAIAAALEKSGPMLSEEEERLGQDTLSKAESLSSASTAESEIQGKKQRKNLLSHGKSESAGKGQDQSKDESEQAPAVPEEKHRGWFGSKDSHSKLSPVISPKLDLTTVLHPPPIPPHPQPRSPPVGPDLLVSALHHTNPFSTFQTTPPPISPCNPFFPLLQHNPFYDNTLTTQQIKPSPPPLPYLSSSRPPIAKLFPQTNNRQSVPIHDETSVNSIGANASSDAMTKTRNRPLPGVPPEEKKGLLRKSSNPFLTFEKPELDSEWDESFEAFAAGRLQSPEDLTADCKTQQKTSSDYPLEHCNNKGGSLLAMTDQTTNVKNESEHQPIQKNHSDTDCLDNFPLLLNREHNLENDNMIFKSSTNFPKSNACTETKNDMNAATDLINTNIHQALYHTSSAQVKNSSPDPSSSGLGSSADDDFLSCLSSHSDKISASSSEETESNMGFDKFSDSAVAQKPSKSEDGIERSTDLSFEDVYQTVIQPGNGESGRTDCGRTSTPHSHMQPVISLEEIGTECANSQTLSVSTVVDPDLLSKSFVRRPTSTISSECENKSEDKIIDKIEDSLADFNPAIITTPDGSTSCTPPSSYITASSPHENHNIDANQNFHMAFSSCSILSDISDNEMSSRLKDFDNSHISNPSLLQNLSVNWDSQHYETCNSQKLSKCSSLSESNQSPHSFHSLLPGDLIEIETPNVNPTQESLLSNQSDRFKDSLCVVPDKTAKVEPSPTIELLPESLAATYRKTSGESVENPISDEKFYRQPQEMMLQRSLSEGTLPPVSDRPPLSCFGSDPGGMKEPCLSQPEPVPPSLTSFAPSLTSKRSSSPLLLSTLPTLANASAKLPNGAEHVATPKPETDQQQHAAKQQTSPHPVKPLTTAIATEEKRSVLASGLEKLKSTISPGRSSQVTELEADRKKSLTEGAGSYYHLTHSELVALLVQREAEIARKKEEFERQKLLLAKREVELRKLKPQVKDLEDYIDTLLVRIMEQKPTLLQVRSKFK